MGSPVYVALDTPDLARAQALAEQLQGHVGGLKIGLELFCAAGPEGVRALKSVGLPIFLDLKLHDIPNTVSKALASVLDLSPAFVTLHLSGGPEMVAAAVAQCQAHGGGTQLLGVTVLTSLGAPDLAMMGMEPDPATQVARLAAMGVDNGLKGFVCSPLEVAQLRSQINDGVFMVPGIRPGGQAKADDQKRTLTPAQAMAAGANYLVVGRPITQAPDPANAAREIAQSLAA